VLRQRGWSKSTFYRKLDGGAVRIAAILGERGVTKAEWMNRSIASSPSEFVLSIGKRKRLSGFPTPNFR
jgi:hypothetical protein